MEIKTIEKTSVFEYATKTNLENLMQAIGNIPNEMTEELKKQSVEISGAPIWSYEGRDGDPKSEFTLRITWPVKQQGKDTNKFRFTELPAYKFIEHTHKGAYSEFAKVYEKLVADITKNGLQLDGTNREVYLNCDFENQENCVTILQIGVN